MPTIAGAILSNEHELLEIGRRLGEIGNESKIGRGGSRDREEISLENC